MLAIDQQRRAHPQRPGLDHGQPVVALADRRCTGTPRLRIPAFSPAISGRVSPRYCWWSMETGVMIVRRGRSMTLVASSRPPRPTSSRVQSAGVRAKARKAAQVVISKKVISSGRWRPRSVEQGGQRRSRRSARPPGGCARGSGRGGARYRRGPVPPALSSPARSMARVEPLPLVPATWITGGRRRSGWPRAASRRSTRSERQVDDLGVQGHQAVENGVADPVIMLAVTARRGGQVAVDGRGLAGQHPQDGRQLLSQVLAWVTRSSMPWSSRYSARWKPSGSVSRMVCSMTRGPAKQISARARRSGRRRAWHSWR